LKQYYNDNKTQILEQKKNFMKIIRQNFRTTKEYYNNNIKQILENRKEYYNDNKTKF
jgi:hypothetical protein